jgi:hypothetical protein
MRVLASGKTIATLLLLSAIAVIPAAYGDCVEARCAPLPGAERPKRPAPSANNMQIIPGQRVGEVTAKTTRNDLVRIYGASRLSDRIIQGPEGIGRFHTTRVNLGERSFTVVWSNAKKDVPLDVREFGTAWKTPEGIGVGSSLAELQKQIGEFQLLGLDWDYGGTVLFEKTKLAKYNGRLILRVAAAPNAADRYPNDYRAVSGDRTLSSNNPHWKPLGIRVRQMIVTLD